MQHVVVSRVLFGFFVSTAFISVFSCKKSPSPEELARLLQAQDELARQNALSEYVASLTDAEKISQLFLVNVERNDAYAPVEREGSLYGRRGEGEALVPGGCLLFSYNIAETPEALASYTASIRAYYTSHNHVPPYVAIDQEGGDVNRLRRITSTLVSQKKTAEWFTAEQAHALYAAQARQLRLLGIQMNLAPVVEVATDANSAFLDTRTFGSLEQVLAYGGAEITAFEENGVATVLKHFPGNSNVDPHTGLPHIKIAESERALFFSPFEQLLPLSSAVLISHAIVEETKAAESPDASSATATTPACFSSYWVSDVVRHQLGFNGLIFSDDIFMGALSANGYPPETAAVSVIEAGIDCIMLSEKTFGSVAGVLLSKAQEDEAFAQKIEASVTRVIAYKIQAGLLAFESVEPVAEARVQAEAAPQYVVKAVAACDGSGFDSAAFEKAYSDGMEFYK